MGDLAGAIPYARRAVAADTLQEEAHAALIDLYMRAGRPADAMRQYQELERLLGTEMGLRPSPATRALLNPAPELSLDSETLPLETDSSDATAARLCASAAPIVPTAGLQLESEGGAVPLDSSFYIERETDSLFTAAVARQDSIVLVKGARLMGKTSLLARGLQKARESGYARRTDRFSEAHGDAVGDIRQPVSDSGPRHRRSARPGSGR